MRLALSILIISSLVLSCKKGQADITLKGTITDQTFGVGLSSSTISLYKVLPGGNDNELVSTIYSSDGTYSFTFKREQLDGFRLVVEKNNYFSIDKEISLNDLSTEEDNVRNYSTTAKAWAKIHLVNDNPQIGDALTYVKQQGKVNCQDCCTQDALTFYGALDTIMYCINDGNNVYSFNYFVQGGVNGTISQTTVAFDTTELLLHY